MRRRLEKPRFVTDGASERTAHMPEQLRFEQRLGQRGAVDRDERPVPPRALIVNHADQEFLARSALARDQHGDVERRDAGGLLEHVLHRVAAHDETLRRGVLRHPLAYQVELALALRDAPLTASQLLLPCAHRLPQPFDLVP